MSLGIAFKGPEGIVLAADSRVTLTQALTVGTQVFVVPSTYDNATKLLIIPSQDYIGAITFGLGAIGTTAQRTAHSFVPEFDTALKQANGAGRLSVEQFADQLSKFFLWQWHSEGMPAASSYTGDEMIFLVGGYDSGAPHGRVFQFTIPKAPIPDEQMLGNNFGMVWGGQREFVDRLMTGFDDSLPVLVQNHLGLTVPQKDALVAHLKANLNAKIPYAFLPLQDCVDLSIFLIRTTISIQQLGTGLRGVGGSIDAAIVTRTGGFQPVEQKVIAGEQGERTAYANIDYISARKR
jgi:hypothetical protein